MEVTKQNFKEILPVVEKSIQDADFLVIDCEFTGLLNGKDPSIFDTPAEYYSCLYNGCSEFMLIQFGLCAFYWDAKKKSYINEVYNFYLFPRSRPGPDKNFLCSSSSLEFLSSQGFDFNKLIKDGISYMSEPLEIKLKDNLAERQKSYSNNLDVIPIPEENKKYIEDICTKVRAFLDDKSLEELIIDKCNAFVRRLLFQEVGLRFKNEAFIETKVTETKNRVLRITKITSENDATEQQDQKKEKEWEDLEDAVGFSKVARMISQSEKLVIGHNMVLDVIHTLAHFFQPLPTEYDSFKEYAHFVFPRLLDTKYMSNLPPFKDKINSSMLQHLLETLSQPPFAIPKSESQKGRGYEVTHEVYHEAGFDAYVTGLCFLSMYTHLTKMRGEPDNRVVSADAAILKPFLNKLFLTRTAYQDSPYINLGGNEPSPPRDHVFYLAFPREWQRSNINQLFSPFGPTTVQFLDETSALVALLRREAARDVVKSLGQSSMCTLMTYSRYKLMKAQQKAAVSGSPVLRSVPETFQSPDAGKPTYISVKTTPTKIERIPVPPSVTPSNTARKRTSSGAFHVDDAEPPAKKLETLSSSHEPPKEGPKTYSEAIRRTSIVNSNGRRKNSGKLDESPPSAKVKKAEVKKKVIERFEKREDVAQECVKAFRESDSWD